MPAGGSEAACLQSATTRPTWRPPAGRMRLPAIGLLQGILMIYDNRQFYIDGAWVDPVEPKEFHVINPATEAVAGTISMGGPKDVDRAVAAARRAFDGYSRTTPAGRLD